MIFPVEKGDNFITPFYYYIIKRKHTLNGVILLLFMFFSSAYAQETPPLVNFPNTVYKAHNQNWAIDQSKDHIIYTANSDGLLEYDGAVWKLYPFPNRQIVRAVLCDTMPNGDSRIYVGGYSEFGYWKKTTKGQLIYHSLSKAANFKSLQTEEIWHILKDGKDIYHSGNSMVIDPLGEVLYHNADDEDIFTIILEKAHVDQVREKFPFWKDGDQFRIEG